MKPITEYAPVPPRNERAWRLWQRRTQVRCAEELYRALAAIGQPIQDYWTWYEEDGTE